MKRFSARKVHEQQDIALGHIRVLFEQAAQCFAQQTPHPELAHHYMQLARRMAMKCRVRLPAHLKRRLCKHCSHYLQPGVNCRVRLGQKRVIYYCLDCRHFMRFPYAKRAKKGKAVSS